jgi:hypothetical protein
MMEQPGTSGNLPRWVPGFSCLKYFEKEKKNLLIKDPETHCGGFPEVPG